MNYNGTTLTMQITDTVTNATYNTSFTVNIPNVVGGSTAYVGFTGGTGGLTAIQDILTWTYTSGTVEQQAATPTIMPGSGTETSPVTVTLTDTTPSATITYTTDGTTPVPGSHGTAISSGGSFQVSFTSTATVEAIASASGFTPSAIATANYTTQSSGGSPSYGSGLTSAGLTLNGGAAINGTRLRLTDGGGSEARSAFFNTLVNVQAFTTTFTFQLTNANADGFTFTIQNKSATALGGGGGSLGYGPTSGTTGGIPNSVALGFQLYSGASGEVNLAGLWTNGASPAATPGTDMSGSGINLHSGDAFKVRIGYTGTTLNMEIWDTTQTDVQNDVHFAQSFTIDIPATVGGDTAYVGFTGGDGGLTSTQDILSWSYSNSIGGTSGTFTWPVDEPAFVGVNDYSTYNGQYHTGLDLCPGAAGCQRGDPIYAAGSGTVQAVQVTTDATQTMCDGSSTGSLTTENNNHLGNAVIIAHSNGKFSVYGHMDCVWPGIAPGVAVSQGQRIGNIGNSEYATRENSFTPHVHFEIKDAGTFGDPTGLGYSGFTPDLPDGYGYHDPRLYLFPFSQSSMSPTAVKVVASPSLNVLTGPDTSYSILNTVTTGQEFVAFAFSGSWYEIYLPNSVGPVSGWIPASAGSQTLAASDSTATQIQVKNTGGTGLLIRPSASSATNFVSWVYNTGYLPLVQNCAPAAKIWDGQFYVTSGNQNGWYQYYLPTNYFFSSASTCQAPAGSGPAFGWSSGTYLNIIP